MKANLIEFVTSNQIFFALVTSFSRILSNQQHSLFIILKEEIEFPLHASFILKYPSLIWSSEGNKLTYNQNVLLLRFAKFKRGNDKDKR